MFSSSLFRLSAAVSYRNLPFCGFFPVLKFQSHSNSIGCVRSMYQYATNSNELVFNKKMFKPLDAQNATTHVCNKVTIVGNGSVAVVCASAIMMRGIASEICLLGNDMVLRSEAMDLNDGSNELRQSCRVTTADAVKINKTRGSKVIVLATGVQQKPGQSDLETANENLDTIKTSIPALIDLSPKTVLVVATDPVDIITLAVWRLSQSKLPLQKVFGLGCELESARFRVLLGEKLKLPKEYINAWVIGSRGNAGICHWSSVSVAGVPLKTIDPSIGMPWGSQEWNELRTKTITASEEIITLKGHENWGVGMAVASVVQSILRNDNSVKCISTLVKGRYQIHEEVFMSLPCTVGERGIGEMIMLNMSDHEEEQFILSAERIEKVVKQLTM